MTDFWFGFLSGGFAVVIVAVLLVAWAILTNDYSK